ncbi:ABC transporter permease [Leifsonia sp. H3M29-4]|uniref:ABC transporter permease n=1 Tax=Salinibacterium metalliresistens TaxID=3031321 RepID=UPI0023DAAAAD|nr:ABC transporter permease [Salinibacterium metalliresistens]MDF1479477.1 ABC transporter permease [Salinibacterium metalliresistens]
MIAIVRATRAELARTFSVRSWWLLALVLFGYVAFTAAILALFVSDLGALMGGGAISLEPEASALLVYTTVTSIGYLFPVLIGALAATTELRHRTITPTLLAEPRRGIVLAGKAVALALVGALYGLVGLAASVGTGAAVIAATGGDPALDDPNVISVLARIVLAMTLWAVIGVGLGSVVGNQVIVIVIVLAFTQFVEPILRLVGGLWEGTAQFARFLPGAATDALVGGGLYASLGALDPSMPSATTLLDWWQGGLVLAGFAAVLLAVGSLTSWRRDVT